MMTLLQPEMAHYADDRRFATPVTPYRRGFEDAVYHYVYANPYPPGSDPHTAYHAGNQDARQAIRTERQS
jgi:hypothetical protein